jgi:hypothetical protein
MMKRALPLLTAMSTGKIGIYGFDDDSHGTIHLTDGVSVYTAQCDVSAIVSRRLA